MPRADALSRSISTFTWGFLIWRSLVTSWSMGSSRSLRLELGRVLVELVGVRALERELVQALGERAADADGRRVLEKRLDPGHLRRAGAGTCWMIWSTCSLRSDRGLSLMKIRPWFPETLEPPAPMLDMKPSTFGSLSTMSATASWCCFMESKEMPCAASVVMNSCARVLARKKARAA